MAKALTDAWTVTGLIGMKILSPSEKLSEEEMNDRMAEICGVSPEYHEQLDQEEVAKKAEKAAEAAKAGTEPHQTMEP